MKAQAFRAVAADDPTVLLELLETLHIDVVSNWQNKAGTDLLTLSEERKSAHAYLVLARAQGKLKDMKRQELKERDNVWVFVKGDVQAKRATVLEDTPEEADMVLLEFWDGELPQEYVDRSQIRRCPM